MSMNKLIRLIGIQFIVGCSLIDPTVVNNFNTALSNFKESQRLDNSFDTFRGFSEIFDYWNRQNFAYYAEPETDKVPVMFWQ